MRELVQKVGALHEELVHLNQLYIQAWQEHVLFSWEWWVTVLLLIGPCVLWLWLRKKESSGRLLLAGAFVYFITSFLDSIGVPFGLWHYSITPLPYLHSFYMPWDFSLFPVTIMLLIQYKPELSPYVKALIFSVTSALIAEPIFVWMEVYQPTRWETYYGLPIYFLIYLVAHRISKSESFARL